MIVCSCNVLSDTQILTTLRNFDPSTRCSPARAYRCLGCAPRCGRCVATVRALLEKAHMENCQVGCATCPGAESERREEARPPMLIAAE